MSADEFASLTATEAAAEIARGAISAEEYTRACLDRIATVDKEISAFAHLDPEHALAQARALDERRRNGKPTGPLNGIPVGIKDIIDTEDYPTEHGSPIFSGRRPRRDATIVARLRSAGAVILGKTVTTEFAFYHPGPTRNPRDREHTPGGSSSGSAAAVAAGMVPLALGTQTNGSVIRPAAFCGVFGCKPSHGSISRSGMLAHSRLLDQPGVFARTLEDTALLLEVIVGHDPEDPDTEPAAAPAFRKILVEAPPLPPRFAFMRTPIWDEATADSRQALESLVEHLGERVDTVELPQTFAEADFLAEGRAIAAVDYFAASDDARALGQVLAKYFDLYDAILTPAAPGVAPRGLASTGDPAFCSLWTLLGLPALSLPILEGEHGLPLGVQLVGAPGDDARLLRTARFLLGTLSGKRTGRRPRKGSR